jgi:hypothetical protein
MSNYTKLTSFDVKDALPSGDVGKRIKGTELDDEFNAISTAVATKVDATASAINSALGSTAVQNATHADSADTATTATTFSTAIFTILESGNTLNFIVSPTITGSISSTTLTVTDATVNFVNIGAVLSESTVVSGTTITNQLTSTESTLATIAYASGGASGASSITLANTTGVVVGQMISGIGVPNGTYVGAINSNTVSLIDKDGSVVSLTTQAAGSYLFKNPRGKGTYTVSQSQTVLSSAMKCTKTVASITSNGVFTASTNLTAATITATGSISANSLASTTTVTAGTNITATGTVTANGT